MKFRFRGRHELTKLWVVGPGIEIREARNPVHDVDEAYIINRGCYTEVEFDTVSQTTGFTEDDGNEVFDGDIVEFVYQDEGLGEMRESFLVEFNKDRGKFVLKLLQSGFVESIDTLNSPEYKHVIGNKWDTPELMKQAV